MSSLGKARVTAVRSSGIADVAGVGMGAVGVAALAGVAVVGTAILIGKGLVWCGQKLEENYQNACNEYTNLVDKARAENMQNVQEMGNYLTNQLDCLAASATLTVSGDGPRSDALDEQRQQVAQKQQLNEAFARTQQILADAQQLVQNRADTQQTLISYRLQAEIAAAQGLLPAQEIAHAQAALGKTPAEMQQALTRLQNAWSRVTETVSVRKHTTIQAQQTLEAVYAQLTALDTLRQNVPSSAQLTLVSQQSSIEQLTREAHDQLDAQPALALEKAREAEAAVRYLTEMISGEIIATWSQRQKELNMLRGMLASLTSMLQEANAVQLLDAEQVKGVRARVQQTQGNLDTLIKAGTPMTPQQLARAKARVDLLKQEVFTLVGTTQQHNVAQTVATTLAELGFQTSDGKQPVLKQQGKIVHIQAVTQSGTAAQRDEKIVSFDIAPDGAISYDFSGYIGDSCINDAQRIFTVLRQKGIFILDERASAVLQHVPTESITAETLQDAHFAPEIVKNKTQAELAESLLRILQKMDYPSIQQRTLGGSIELEAFKGPVGYRVILSPEGETRILKDAQRTDVSADAHDPLATEVRRVSQQTQEIEEEEEVKEKRHRSVTFQQKKQQTQG